MTKVLSIIIPTYNMASLLPRCLDSLVASEALQKLDIIVVNDGSKDNSLEVAQSYASKHQEIRIIDKPNGNYGSTINAALPVAEGKYVKILDSDDWFDSAELTRYVTELEALDTDMSVAHFNVLHDDGSVELTKYNVYGREPYEYGKVYDLDEVLGGGYIRFFLMHSLAWRTDLLRSIGYRQTEGISYTDIEWATYPLFHARTIVFHDITLYQYNLAREGQTMDPAVIRRSLPQLEKMTLSLIEYYRKADWSSMSDTRRMFLRQHLRNRLRLLMKSHLLDIPRSSFDKESFARLFDGLQAVVDEFGLESIQVFPENKIIRIDVCRYWLKHHDRLPIWFEKINHLTDKVVKKAFRVLFH